MTSDATKIKIAALSLTNYPWIRLARTTSLIRDASAMFGKTRVHNDVQYHWQVWFTNYKDHCRACQQLTLI